MHDEELLQIARRLVTDEEYRKWFMTSPKQVLMAELGVSPQVFESLMAVVPALLVGGAAVALGEGWDGPLQGGWSRS